MCVCVCVCLLEFAITAPWTTHCTVRIRVVCRSGNICFTFRTERRNGSHFVFKIRYNMPRILWSCTTIISHSKNKQFPGWPSRSIVWNKNTAPAGAVKLFPVKRQLGHPISNYVNYQKTEFSGRKYPIKNSLFFSKKGSPRTGQRCDQCCRFSQYIC